LRAAADHQDKNGGESVSVPAREMLADMLLELKRPSEAIAEYRTVLKNSPNRFDGFSVPRAPHKQPATRVVLNRITPNWRKSVARAPIVQN